MLYGRYEHTIDSKNRVFVPAKYKDTLGDSFKLSYNGFNRCILVYSNEEWQKYEEKLAHLGRNASSAKVALEQLKQELARTQAHLEELDEQEKNAVRDMVRIMRQRRRSEE